MEATELLLVGRIGRPHGLKGECKVIPECDNPTRLLGLKQVWVGTSSAGSTGAMVSSIRLVQTKRGTTALLRLDGSGYREDAARYMHLNLYARQQDLPPLAPGEYFLHDLVGLNVTTTGGAAIGVVKDVWEMPANNVYVVARKGKVDALIPAVPEFVHDLDLARRCLVVAPIEGLLD